MLDASYIGSFKHYFPSRPLRGIKSYYQVIPTTHAHRRATALNHIMKRKDWKAARRLPTQATVPSTTLCPAKAERVTVGGVKVTVAFGEVFVGLLLFLFFLFLF